MYFTQIGMLFGFFISTPISHLFGLNNGAVLASACRFSVLKYTKCIDLFFPPKTIEFNRWHILNNISNPPIPIRLASYKLFTFFFGPHLFVACTLREYTPLAWFLQLSKNIYSLYRPDSINTISLAPRNSGCFFSSSILSLLLIFHYLL